MPLNHRKRVDSCIRSSAINHVRRKSSLKKKHAMGKQTNVAHTRQPSLFHSFIHSFLPMHPSTLSQKQSLRLPPPSPATLPLLLCYYATPLKTIVPELQSFFPFPLPFPFLSCLFSFLSYLFAFPTFQSQCLGPKACDRCD